MPEPEQDTLPEPENKEAKENGQDKRNLQTPVEEAMEWFEVLKSMVFIKAAPTKDASSRGIVRKGQRIQVLSRRILDAELHEWVELTQLQLLQFPSDEKTATSSTRGFALIDGTHLGLGQLLQGPVEPEQSVQVIEEEEEKVDEQEE